MMTTLVSSINAGLDPRQMQPMQLKADEKTAAEELKAEEQQQAETISAPNTKIANSTMDIRMLQIHQAADAGILRPVWLEMLEMDHNMPRMSDIIRKAGESKDGNAERVAEEVERAEKAAHAEKAERAENSRRTADGAERAVKAESAANEARAAMKSERATDGAERTTVRSERASDGAERTAKNERASDKASPDI